MRRMGDLQLPIGMLWPISGSARSANASRSRCRRHLFNLGRHLISANHYQYFRQRVFTSWKEASAL
jgi:hypothetical protein